ncbi:MAG: MFS transporter [Dehalococcoidia bacterium]|nr:MFS transporter [Dehalococcoidia bacterium]
MAHGHGQFGHTGHEDPKTTERKWGIFRVDTFAALKHRNYRYHRLSHSVGGMASWGQTVTLALLVNELTDSSFWAGTVLSIRALPILIVGPLAGVAIDRFDRKKLLMATQLALAVMAWPSSSPGASTRTR